MPIIVRPARQADAAQCGRITFEAFQTLADQIYREDVALSRSKLIVGGLLGVIGTLGYYSAYLYVIWR